MLFRINSIKTTASWALSLIFLLLLACSSEVEPEIENIDSDIIVSVDIINENVTIVAESDKLYPMSGYRIVYEKIMRANNVFVKFKHVEVPNLGLTILSSAVGLIDLGKLEDGDHDISFELNGQKTLGMVKIGPNIELTLDEGSNVRVR